MISHDSTVFVVDGEQKCRAAVARLVEDLGFRCQTHGAASDLLDHFDATWGGCIVTELVLPDLSGLHLHSRLAKLAEPAMPVVFLTDHATVRASVSAMRAGALHFLEKPLPTEDLREAIYEAVYFDQERRRARRWHQQVRSRLGDLTIKEEWVLQLMGQGFSAREIASRLEVSIRTVELRRSKVMKKLGVTSLSQLERLSRQPFMTSRNRDRVIQPGLSVGPSDMGQPDLTIPLDSMGLRQ